MENPLEMVVLMGKSPINGSFSMAMLNNQRVVFDSGSYWNIHGFTLCLTSIAMGKKTHFLMGKLTVSMAILDYQRVYRIPSGHLR